MIITQQTGDIVKQGFSSKKATINPNEVAKLQYILTKGLYEDAESAVIVEWSNNAIDSVIQSGKDVMLNPVLVELTQKYFRVSDTGLGLSLTEFEDVCMSYLTSTKADSNEAIGAFGIGMKSFVALDRPATFTIRKDGVECKVLAYLGEQFLEYDLIYQRDTTECNGVIAEIQINNWNEFNKFRDKCRNKLCYYDGVILSIDSQIVENQIVRSEHWQRSKFNSNEMQLCLKDVVYDIDWNKLGINPIYVPIALRFSLDSGLTPTPSRQSLIWNQFTIDLVKDKIEKVADWFVDKINEKWVEHESIIPIWSQISNKEVYFKVGDQDLQITNLVTHSKKAITDLKVKGINLLPLKFFKNHSSDIFAEYKVIVDNTYRKTWKVKHLSDDIGIQGLVLNNYKVIHVNHVPSGYLRDYLTAKYPGPIKFVKRYRIRQMGDPNDDWRSRKDSDYLHLLELVMKPEEQWQDYINEWNLVEKQFTSLIHDETDVLDSEEYNKWLVEEKARRKNNAVYSNKNYKTLNKQEGEVTVGFCREMDRGRGLTFEKKTLKIQDLHKRNRITIYFEEEEKELAKAYYWLLNARFDIAIVGKREKLKIQDKHNFMTVKEFEKSKPFKRIVTSILFDDLLTTYRDLLDRRAVREIIENCIPALEQDYITLSTYVDKNAKRINNEVLTAMIEVAREYDLWDYELMPVYNRMKDNIGKYSFIKYFQAPDRWDSETNKEVNSLINQVLYHRKFNKGMNVELLKEEV